MVRVSMGKQWGIFFYETRGSRSVQEGVKVMVIVE